MKEIESLVKNYERGRLSRRVLIGALTAMVASGRSTLRGQSSTFEAVGLNHIALSVADVARSADFYIEHLGLEVSSRSQSSAFLNFGDQFLALFRASDPGMHHYCYSVRDYDVNRAAEKLRAVEIQPDIRGNRIYFPDPDGLTVQLASPGHVA
jgi:hypothetical protein